jgi:DNA-binding transcriptional MerR regulator
MEYSAQDLAKQSGISVRTLRYYDEIGLLVPKIRMANGRCYYGIKELFYLSQIILLKDFGFSLEKIKSILNSKEVCKTSALIAQKKILKREQDRLKSSLQMIESMIKHSKEKREMNITPEMIDNCVNQLKSKQEYAKYFDEAYMEEKAREIKDNFRLRVGDEYYDIYIRKTEQQNISIACEYGSQYGLFLRKLIASLENGLDEGSIEVQNLMGEQWEILQMVYPDTRSQKVYFAIRDQLCSFPPEMMNQQAEALSAYMSKAMTIYSETHFTEE